VEAPVCMHISKYELFPLTLYLIVPTLPALAASASLAILTPPLTSSVADGVAVLIPTVYPLASSSNFIILSSLFIFIIFDEIDSSYIIN